MRCGPRSGPRCSACGRSRAVAGSGLAGPADVVRRVATGPVARLLLVAAVMFAGWHFFAR